MAHIEIMHKKTHNQTTLLIIGDSIHEIQMLEKYIFLATLSGQTSSWPASEEKKRVLSPSSYKQKSFFPVCVAFFIPMSTQLLWVVKKLSCYLPLFLPSYAHFCKYQTKLYQISWEYLELNLLKEHKHVYQIVLEIARRPKAKMIWLKKKS